MCDVYDRLGGRYRSQCIRDQRKRHDSSLRPEELLILFEDDLPAIVDDLVPRLQRAGRFRTGYRDGETLRERLGLAPAPNRYATAAS